VQKAKQDFQTDVLVPVMGTKKTMAWINLPWTAITKSHFVHKAISPLVLKNQMTDSSRNSAVQIVLHVLNLQTVRSPNTRKHTHITTTKK
jgi:hypothetical protein